MAIAFDANLGSDVDGTTLTTTAAAAALSRVFLMVWHQHATATISGASGGGLTWVVDRPSYNGGTSHHITLLSADAPSGLASSTVITPTVSGGPADFGPAICACSFTGLKGGASGYIDVSITDKVAFGVTTWTTNNYVTTNANDLLFVFDEGNGAASNAPDGNTTEIHDFVATAGPALGSGYRIVSSASTYTLGGTWNASADNLSIGAAYKDIPTTPAINPDYSNHPKPKLRRVSV